MAGKKKRENYSAAGIFISISKAEIKIFKLIGIRHGEQMKSSLYGRG